MTRRPAQSQQPVSYPFAPSGPAAPVPPSAPFEASGPLGGAYPAAHVALGPFALLNDEPVGDPTQDLLDARKAAARLTALLTASRGATPFTLAVDAGWGMGKSSLMRLVDAQLRAFDGVHTVWYNAWTSTGPDALEGLIKSVLGQLDPRILRRWARRLRERRPLVALLRAVTLVAAGPLGVSAMVDEVWRALSADAGARNAMRDALRGLVAEWTDAAPAGPGGRHRMLVVFVDDLDRCSEETFLAVCEAVKVYLDVPGLAFVIGCDRAAIGPGGLLPNLSPTGAAFVEKIFQTTYRVPPPSTAALRGYVRSCARAAGVEHLLDDALVALIAQRAARNPRRVKRLLNGLLLEAMLNPVWRGGRLDAAVRALLLQYLYPEFYRMMTMPASWGDGDVVADFRMYRRIREHVVLGGPMPDGWETFLLEHAVSPAAVGTAAPAALADLEQQLPTCFPVFVTDPAFTSLVDELVALPEADQVLRGLRGLREGGTDAPDGPLPSLDGPLPPPYGPAPSPYGQPYGPPQPAPQAGPAWYPAHPRPGQPLPPADEPADGPGGEPEPVRRPPYIHGPVGGATFDWVPQEREWTGRDADPDRRPEPEPAADPGPAADPQPEPLADEDLWSDDEPRPVPAGDLGDEPSARTAPAGDRPSREQSGSAADPAPDEPLPAGGPPPQGDVPPPARSGPDARVFARDGGTTYAGRDETVLIPPPAGDRPARGGGTDEWERGRRMLGTAVLHGFEADFARTLTARLWFGDVRVVLAADEGGIRDTAARFGPPLAVVVRHAGVAEFEGVVELCGELRRRYGARAVPAVVYAPRRTPSDETLAGRLDGHVAVDPDDLVGRIKAALTAARAAPTDPPARPYGDRP